MIRRRFNVFNKHGRPLFSKSNVVFTSEWYEDDKVAREEGEKKKKELGEQTYDIFWNIEEIKE